VTGALEAALAAGIILRAEGDRLALRAPGPVDPALRARLAGAKAEILGFLGPGRRIGPASPIQRAIWLADAAGRGYAITAATRLRGAAARDMTPALLGAALDALAARHPALRSRLLLVGQEAAQLVEPDAALPLDIQDTADAQAALAQWCAAAPDPTVAPPGRALLLRQGPEEAVFAFSLHHAFCDAGSLDVLGEELALLIGASGPGGHRAALPAPGADPLDAAAAARLAAVHPDRVAWWDATLRGVPPVELGAEPLRQASGAGRLGATIPAGCWQGLAGAGRALGATPFATLLGLCGIVLRRHAGDARLLLHMPATTRGTGFERSVGCFATVVPVVLDLSDAPSAEDAIRRAAAASAGAIAHADIPQDALAAVATQATRPRILVTHRRGAPGLGEAIALPSPAAKADLVIETSEGPEGLAISLEWDRAAVDDGIAGAILDALAAAVGDVAAGRAPGLPAAQRALHAALAPDWPAEDPAPLHARFAEQAAAAPARIAVRAADAVLTYAALDAWSDAIAASLGPARGAVFGIALPRGAAMVAAWLGCLKAGAAYLPLDPAWPQARRDAVLAAAGARRVLDAPALPPQDEAHPGFVAPPVHPLALACVFATSGSTGVPKPVGVPHGAIPRLALDRALADIAPGDVVAQAGSAAFDAASWEVWGALLNGATLAVIDLETVLDADRLAAEIAALRVRHMVMTRTLFDAVAATRPDAFAGLATLIVGGEPLDPRACGAIAPPGRFVNGYGPTEAATFSARYALPPDVGTLRRVPVGQAVRGTVLRVLDDAMRPAAIGAPAELWIGGDALARGYLGQPGMTADRFRPDPSGPPGARLYRSGDRVRLLPDGMVDMLGRTDGQVKIRGFRVEPGEVRAALHAIPGVAAAHAAAVRTADGTMALRAWVVGIPAEQALDRLRAVLPAAMVPGRAWRVDRLPVTTSGKVDVAALPHDDTPDAARTGAAPQGAVEQAVAALVCEVLGLPGIGRDDDIFALGAHSLSAMRLLARLRAHFGAELPLRAVFEAGSVAGLAARLPAAPTQGAQLPQGAPPTLLPAQERLWLLERLGGGAAWHVPVAVRLRGAVDVAALRAALDALPARHAALRTGMVERDGRPVAVEHPAAPVPLAVHDAPQDLDAALAAEAARPFDLAAGPFLRAALWRIGTDDHVLMLVLHHAAADGWSLGVLLREAAALYAGRPLPPPPRSVHDWAAALRAQDAGDAIAFWRTALAGAQPLRLPMRGAGGPGYLRVRLPAGLAEAARRLGTTPFVLGLAAWAAVLARRADATDLLVGTVLAGRDHPDTEAMVGMLVQTLPLRLDLGGDPPGATVVARAMAALEAAHAHRAAPFERIVEAAGAAGGGRDALLRHLVVLQNHPWPDGGLGALVGEEVPVAPPAAKTDTTLAMDAGLGAAALEYAAEAMGEAEAAELLAAFGRVLAAIAADPARRVSAMPVVADAVVLDGPAAGAVPPLLAWGTPDRVVPVDRTTAAPVLVAADATLDSDALRARVERMAGRLVAFGAGPEVLVGICAGRSAAQVVALLATLRAGAAWLPLEPGLPAARLRAILDAARPALILADETGRAALAAADAAAVPLPIDGAGLADGAAPDRDPPPLAAAYVLFTSGSTGAPKAVVVPRLALARHMAWMDRALPLGPGDRLLLKTPMGFDASVWEYLAPLRGGAALHVAPEGAQADAAALLAAIAAARATVLQLVPSVAAALLREPGFDAACASLRRLCLGGEAVPRSLAEDLARRLPGCRLVNLYGPAEATIQTVVQDGFDPEDAGATMPIGQPIEGTRARLVDRWGADVARGAPGRLLLSGQALARGYLGRPDLTAERFRPDPLGAPGERTLHTGDLARLRGAGGPLEWLGRADRQGKIHGVRVEPAEVEAALRALPGVAEAAAAIVEGPLLIAWVVAPGQDAAALRAALAARLPPALVPARIVPLPALPRLPSGKTDYRALPKPVDTAATSDGDLLEQAVAAIMASLLGIDEVPRDADFFALGGHSLLAAQLAARLREATGRDLPLDALFAAPSPAGIAALLGGAGRSGALPVLPEDVALPLGSAQRRLWAELQLRGDDGRWVMGGPMVLRGALDTVALEAALAAIVARHEPLRTRILLDADDLPVQRVDPPRFRLEHGAAPSVEAALAEASGWMARRFDLAAEPPFRARLIRVAPDAAVLVLALHHIAGDGWSLGVLVRELVGLMDDPPAALPPVARYAAVAAWMDAQDTAASLGWWRARLAGLPRLRLPGERAAPGADPTASVLPLRFDGAAARLARACGATEFMALMAALAAALHEATGQLDLALATDVADRRHVAAEGLIGFFANPLLLRIDMSGVATGRAVVGRVRAACLEAFAHQHVPANLVAVGLPPVRCKLSWQPAPPVPPRIGRCTVEWGAATPPGLPYDLLFNLFRDGDGVAGAALHRPAALDRVAVEALVARMAALLGTMAADPDATLGTLAAGAPPPVATAAMLRRRTFS